MKLKSFILILIGGFLVFYNAHFISLPTSDWKYYFGSIAMLLGCLFIFIAGNLSIKSTNKENK